MNTNLKTTLQLLVISMVSLNFVATAEEVTLTGSAGTKINIQYYLDFNEPWAMTFLPDGRLLVTEKPGKLLLVNPGKTSKIEVSGIPEVAYKGQGGFGDIILHPRYSKNNTIYISYAEEGPRGKRGAAVARARLVNTSEDATLKDLEVIWRQTPKVKGSGHYSHRLVFGPDAKLYITSGERQKQQPAQDWNQDLGKIIRLNDDGSIPADNPYQDRGMRARSFWSIGHRNMLGIAFDTQGRLWAHEMGPKHGDELNLIKAGENYGWPIVSWGDQYSGVEIPDHDTRPEFAAPATYWVPTIAPSGLIIYHGNTFTDWQGNFIIGGLASRSLIRVRTEGSQAQEIERFDMGKRIREIEQGPDGAIWVLEDRVGGRLLRITPEG